MIKKADTQLIKLLNEVQILNLIRENSPISRVEIARQNKMSKVAVFEIVKRLINRGFVLDIGKGQSTKRGGKRPTLVTLDANKHFVIGVELKRRQALLAVANIEAEILKTKNFNFEVGAPPEVVIDKMFKRIDTMMDNCGVKPEQLVSIAIGIPGLLDYRVGKLHFADTLKGWGDVLIRDQFEARFHVPVILENDANTVALGESILGAGRDHKDMVCIWIGEGVGAGIIVQNELVQGAGGAAGEIGYLEINKYCRSDRLFKYLFKDQRFFGEILSELNLLQVLNDQIVKSTGKEPEKNNLVHILKTNAYHEHIREILEEYAYLLGILCLDMIKILNPRLLVLSGDIIENSPFILEQVKAFMKENTHEIPLDTHSLVVGELREEAGLRGAIALALQVVFEPKMAGKYPGIL